MKRTYTGQAVVATKHAPQEIREAGKLLVVGVQPVDANCNCGAGRRDAHRETCRMLTAPRMVTVTPMAGGGEFRVLDRLLADATSIPEHLAEHAA